MISEELFRECLVILQDDSILEEDQAERISTLIASKTPLEGTALENEVLDVLWRHRSKGSPAASPPIRYNHTIVRRASPAPWQFGRVGTPTSSLGGTPPMAPPGFPPSMRGSPFPSPRPSPMLAYSSPLIPHSPTLNNYEPVLNHELHNTPTEVYGDFGSETVQWLIGDDSSLLYGGGPTQNMSPHDMLRSVLGEGRSDEQIDQALESCAYDLGATLQLLMEQQQQHNMNQLCVATETTIIGKSTTPILDKARPITPRNGIVCRFFLSTGQCLRADCRFSHDLGTTICKYWLMGSCLAGETCIFSHDPTMSVSKMTLGSDSQTSTPPPSQFQFQDPSSFPSLPQENWGSSSGSGSLVPPPPGFRFSPPRPSSRQLAPEWEQNHNLAPPVDDSEAFPSLGSVKTTSNKKRDRRNKNDVPAGPSSLAEVVRMGSPGPNSVARNSTSSTRWPGGNTKKASRVSAAHIPPPQQIPWLDTGNSLNRTYLKHRKEALNHGVLRARYLQMASTAWQRNDAKAAKEYSRKANNENLAMVKAHKEAAKAIYEERNAGSGQGVELFVDLHGLLPDEAVKYLEDILLAHQKSSQLIYAIVGTSHHSKNGKDKLSRAVRAFLDEWRYPYREFSAMGDRNSTGGILGIDPSSFDKSLHESTVDGDSSKCNKGGTTSLDTAGLTRKKDPPKGPGKKK